MAVRFTPNFQSERKMKLLEVEGARTCHSASPIAGDATAYNLVERDFLFLC